MAEVDYGYGDQEDYGYGDAAPEMDYGYGDAAPEMDYGYGDAAPEMDYGYGDAAPETDYGYGDAAPETDYGYGDTAPAKPEEDYGYGEPDSAPAPQKDRRPKRRCSVTKFSLATETPLTAASVINDFRAGLVQSAQEPADDCKSAITDETGSMDMEFSPCKGDEAQTELPKTIRKKGMMSRIRKRLSIAM
jgi:hypothetical protein